MEDGTMPHNRRSLAAFAFLVMVCTGPAEAVAWELSGTKQILFQTRDGATIPIGNVTFSPAGEAANFSIDLDRKAFANFFLSMREFRCLEGPEVQCHVPYPYNNPRSVTRSDLAWLEHSLIFFLRDALRIRGEAWQWSLLRNAGYGRGHRRHA
jgi:hypothetical protein